MAQKVVLTNRNQENRRHRGTAANNAAREAIRWGAGGLHDTRFARGEARGQRHASIVDPCCHLRLSWPPLTSGGALHRSLLPEVACGHISARRPLGRVGVKECGGVRLAVEPPFKDAQENHYCWTGECGLGNLVSDPGPAIFDVPPQCGATWLARSPRHGLGHAMSRHQLR